MPVFKVNVKWAKEKYDDLELNTDEPPLVFKAQLFAMSGVHPERQKLMIKGAVIKDDEWGSVKLKDGMTLLLMGSAGELPQEPADKPVFMEDMSEQQLASAMEMPAGLTNLGNTCYMNATIQCLRAVPELKDALKKYSGGLTVAGAIAPADSITAALRDLTTSMERSAAAIPPLIFLQVLHMAFPRFSEKGEGGVYVQQDANECWVEIMRSLQQKLTTNSIEEGQGSASAAAAGFIDQYFGGEFESEMKCKEAPDEEATKSREKFLQLSCFIDQDVKYMHTGLKNRMEESIVKNSPTLGRDAEYVKTNTIRRIPAYLTIQFVRFHYKESKAVNAKLLRDVKFPMMLDVFDLCSPELQQKLIPMRDRFKEEDERLIEISREQGPAKKGEEEKKKLIAQPYSFPDDHGSNNSGFYELAAVLTHKGRSSSSGHYVAWVKKKGDDWFMFDDDKVAPCKGEDILKLSGGGDWHCAYVLLYAPRVLMLEPSS
ncbi:ubiquitin carboxyl-terminal hydrolase 14-like [Littorina saxatilis]|uniref:Ubiquitin carboxyl-terminal hydrolase n=1 Tax=Littorina saxatilis TaxID=31220 RepID=A0AAN9GAP5_9CAEN